MAEAKDVVVNVLTSTITTLVIIFLLIPLLKIPVPAVKETETVKEKYYYPYVMPVQLEGDYSKWTLMWKRSYIADTHPAKYPSYIYILEDLDQIIIISPSYPAAQVLKLSDGTLLQEFSILHYGVSITITPSALQTYLGFVVSEAGAPTLKIYKKGSLQQTINLQSTIRMTTINPYYNVVFSYDGKYILVNEDYGAHEYALFKGS